MVINIKSISGGTNYNTRHKRRTESTAIDLRYLSFFVLLNFVKSNIHVSYSCADPSSLPEGSNSEKGLFLMRGQRIQNNT